MDKFRIEKDLLGEMPIPAEAYYGIHTVRAYENFCVSDEKPDGVLIKTMAWVKKACVLANQDGNKIEADTAGAIADACNKIAAGGFNGQFIVNPIQGGAGTSFNMNANEVIANLSLEALGYEKSNYDIIDPLAHVNMSQSTNDVLPTALNLALILKLEPLLKALADAIETLHVKSKELESAVKMGRTHLNMAVPISFGQSFDAYAAVLDRDYERIKQVKNAIGKVPLGGTIVGTGLNTSPSYRKAVISHLQQISGIKVEACANLADGIQNVDDYTSLLSALKVCILNLSKIASDLRLLGSDAQYGIGELLIPARQIGSSFMPEKVNPVMAELINHVSFLVCGYDLAVSMAAQAGQLELNVYKPTISYCLFKSIGLMTEAISLFNEFCLKNLKAALTIH